MGPKSRLLMKTSDVQFAVSTSLAVLLGILGVAGIVPFWFALGGTIGTLAWAVVSLWRSRWLSSRSLLVRTVVIGVFVAMFVGVAYPALRKLANKDDSVSAPTVTQTAGDCASNIVGNGNKATVDCGDKSKK